MNAYRIRTAGVHSKDKIFIAERFVDVIKMFYEKEIAGIELISRDVTVLGYFDRNEQEGEKI